MGTLRIGKVVRQLREAANLTLADLAEAEGVKLDAGNLSRFELGKQGLQLAKLEALAVRLGVPVSQIYARAECMAAGIKEAVSVYDLRSALAPMRNVPIRGVARSLGQDGFFSEEPLASPTFVPYPTDDSGAFALLFKGDAATRPRIKNGDYVVVLPRRQCLPGDDLVAEFRDGRRMVKELLYIRGGEATFGSVRDREPPVTVATEDITMQFLAGILPRGAIEGQ